MASTDTFGHFLLPLTMNKGHIDVQLADRIFEVRNRYLKLKFDRPERHAIRNLLGMLSFRLDRFEEALEYLDKVLSPDEDPKNLNALANRKYICEKLFMFPEARHCQEVLTKLLAQDGTEDCEKRCRQLRARSLAEHAFAYSYELFEESVTSERYRKTVALYEEAKTLACDTIDKDEKEDWLGVYGMACHKIYTKSKSGPSSDEGKTWFQKAVKSFMIIAQNSKNCSLLSESWRHLGELFQKSQKNIYLLPSIPEQFKEYVSQPLKCFEKALSIAPRDPRILARCAAHHQRERNYSEALSKVHKSIEMDSTVFNIHAFYVRARIFMDKYEKQQKDAKKYRGKIPDVNLLENAEKDLKRALQFSPSPWYFQFIAKIFYFKATDSNGSMKHGSQGKKNLQLALTYCAKAVGCQDGQKTGGIHKLRGDCLCAMDEHHAALECFKRAVECEHAVQFYGASIHSLVAEYKHVCKATATIPADDSSFVADMVYWLHMVANICLSINWTLRSLQELKQLSNHWKNIVKYCNDNNYQAALETIELAAIDAEKRPPHIFRQYSVPAPGEGFVPVASTRRLQSFPGAGTTETAAWTSTDHTPAPTATDMCHAEVFRTSPTEVTATPTHQTPAENVKDKTAVESVTTSLAAITLHETANSASDTIQITYSVNLKTGKTQHVSTSPPTQEKTTDDVPRKHVRSAPERPFNRLEFKYDFFVIYSDSASEWVQHRMLQELEETRLKGCIKDRDFPPEKPYLVNYADSVKDSACTVIVITKDFETDQRCFHATLMALELDRLVIPVVREERDIPLILKPLPRLDATGAVDWASLQRSIEQHVPLEKSK